MSSKKGKGQHLL